MFCKGQLLTVFSQLFLQTVYHSWHLLQSIDSETFFGVRRGSETLASFKMIHTTLLLCSTTTRFCRRRTLLYLVGTLISSGIEECNIEQYPRWKTTCDHSIIHRPVFYIYFVFALSNEATPIIRPIFFRRIGRLVFKVSFLKTHLQHAIYIKILYIYIGDIHVHIGA